MAAGGSDREHVLAVQDVEGAAGIAAGTDGIPPQPESMNMSPGIVAHPPAAAAVSGRQAAHLGRPGIPGLGGRQRYSVMILHRRSSLRYPDHGVSITRAMACLRIMASVSRQLSPA